MAENRPEPEEIDLWRLAAEVADGRGVDWRNHHPSDPDASWMEDLRAIEALAEAMRRPPQPVAPAPRIAAGVRLGRFRVEWEAQSGGMGIVYRAQDEVLERPVALKLLPPDVVHSPGRLAQLTREAQLLASLNHPNIAIIHGMEDSAEGLRYLVLEWVPGETLAARLRRGPLSIAEGFEVCLQVAHALAAAHAAGVIHRDLKPGNIMIAADGRVKVVDFGLAQRFVPSEDRPSSQAPTTITGTLGYLAPECLHGQGDHRVDVFAFGCVLYECLTGKAAFPGASAEQILEAIAQAEPDASALPSQCSPALKRILDDCLRKDPKERAASFLQIAQDLEAARHKRPLDRRTFRVGFPSPGTRFVGRLQETKQCRALLEPGGMVTLTGPGGVGKTRLAISVAESLEPELEGLGFVDLASVQNPDGVPEALAAALEIKDEPPLPLLERIRKHLADSRTLIVLDNCEHVAGAVSDLVTTLRSSCPELSILATSRMSLHLPGERTYVVEPLPIPMDDGTEDPRTLARCEAVQLFVERAAGTDASFVPDAQALLSIARICRRVEGLPLAIELAAARVPVLSLDEIATRLDRQLQLLRDNTGRMAPRHRALHAAIAWSVRQLRPSEARLFRALSVFQDGWDLAAATAIGSVTDEFETLDLLASLIDKSLVFATVTRAGTSRYRFLEPVRQFARSQLAADPEDTVAQRRHVAYFVALVEEAEPHLFGALMGPWLDRLATEHANLLAALDACYEDPEGVETGLRIAGSLGRYWHVRGHVGLGTRQLERMLRREGAEAPGAARAKALSMAGALASWRGASEEATICLEEALSLFRSLGDRLWEGRSLMTLGSVYFHLGDTERAWSICEAGLAVSKEVDDVRGIATVLINLGVLAYGRGDKGSAHRLFGEAAALHRRSGDQATLALALGNRSALSVQLGDYASARSELAEALRLALELDAVWSGIAALASAGTMALARGAPGEAAVMLAAATSGVERAELDLSAGQRNELDRIVAQVRDASAPESFAEAWSKGLAFSFPEAADFVLGWLLRDQTATS